MRLSARGMLGGMAAALVMTIAAPLAHASFGVEGQHFEAITCAKSSCTYLGVEKDHSEAFTKAAGHPPFGITAFEFNSEAKGLGKEPQGNVKNVRVDIPPGLAANPEALPPCPVAQFEKDECPTNTEVGVDELEVSVPGTGLDETVKGQVFNLVQPEGVPLEFGIHVSLAAPLPAANEHIFLIGHLSWNTDYHEYFEIDNISKTVGVLKSKLIFNGVAGTGFITLPSECSTSNTSHLRVESYEGQVSETETHTPVGVEECAATPFSPTLKIAPETPQSDRADGPAMTVELPQSSKPTETDSSDLRTTVVTLPEGMTLNPAAANGLVACSDAQIGIKTTNPVQCPAASKIGMVAIETPDLPAGSLTGNVYVGQPLSTEPQSGKEYRIFIDAESPRYGISVRLEGHVSADPATGRLTTTFADTPQLPFSSLVLKLEGGSKAPLANPLACGPATTNASFTPYNGNPAVNQLISFPIDFDGKGGTCTSPLPFSLSQSASSSPSTGGSTTDFTLNLTRPEGNQYLSHLSVTLPPGLVGKIPLVALCGEPQAAQGACSSASQIGTATAALGAGPSPLALSGPVYLTSGYNGYPYGLSVAVDASKVGPYDFGTIVTRAGIDVDPHTARVTVASALPTIVGGTPLRIRSIAVEVNRSGFMLNPTNCSSFSTNTTLASTGGSTQSIATPFQASGCGALAFAPAFTASTSATTSRANGASLTVEIGYPSGSQANIRSVVASLPKQLSSRLSTLNKACLASTFEANPSACPPGSRVGVATASTPVLPDLMLGPAYFVSHGGAAFPDLDLVLQGDGVTVILTGNTNISNGVTTSTFASLPDVPVSSFLLSLPAGPNSALAANGSLCVAPLLMPTTITAQNGKVVKQNTQIAVAGCRPKPKSPPHRLFRIISHRVRGHTAILVVQTYLAGRLSAGGHDLRTARRTLRRATRRVTLRVALSRAGLRALRRVHRDNVAHHRHRRLRLRLRVAFKPAGARGASLAAVMVAFK